MDLIYERQYESNYYLQPSSESSKSETLASVKDPSSISYVKVQCVTSPVLLQPSVQDKVILVTVFWRHRLLIRKDLRDSKHKCKKDHLQSPH